MTGIAGAVVLTVALTSSTVTAFVPTSTTVCSRASAAPWRPAQHHRRHDPSSCPLNALSLPDTDAIIDPLLLQHIATGGILSFAGDVIAQSLTSEAREVEGKFKMPPSDWDRVRTAAFVAFGGIYTGGVQHFIFGYLNAAYDEPLQRLLLAQFFFIPFCYYPTFLAMVPFLRAGWEQGGDFSSPEASIRQQELFGEVYGKIPSTLIRNWCFWLPVQFVQFSFIPTDLQVNYAAAFGVIWNAILSWSTSSSATTSEK